MFLVHDSSPEHFYVHIRRKEGIVLEVAGKLEVYKQASTVYVKKPNPFKFKLSITYCSDWTALTAWS